MARSRDISIKWFFKETKYKRKLLKGVEIIVYICIMMNRWYSRRYIQKIKMKISSWSINE